MIQAIISFAIFIVGLISFIKVEKKAQDPIISLDLFTNKTYVVVNLIAALISGFLMGVEVYIPMWMQGVLGKSAALGGIVLAPMSVIWMFGSFAGGKAMRKWSAKKAIFISMLPILVGAIFLSLAQMDTAYGIFYIFSAILGIGFGMTMTILTVLAQTSVDSHHTGVATSFFTLSRTIGQTIMISVFGLVLNASMNQGLAEKKELGVTKDMMNKLINPHTVKELPTALVGDLREILYNNLHQVYLVGIVLVVLSFVLNYFQKEEPLS
ncbi:MFS transporter [Vagococcus carniphilus]|uniref:MFS transporter n=1 Tax=Vagococcus carniphilus TaxID=218144 RepID=UPI003B5A4470